MKLKQIKKINNHLAIEYDAKNKSNFIMIKNKEDLDCIDANERKILVESIKEVYPEYLF